MFGHKEDLEELHFFLRGGARGPQEEPKKMGRGLVSRAQGRRSLD